MRRLSLIFMLCLLASPLAGQDYIHRDYYGQGNTAQEALHFLLAQIGREVFPGEPSLADTYRPDIARAAVEQVQNGKMVLTLTGTALDVIFQARQTRTSDILAEGRKTGSDTSRKTYYIWAWYYLCSLPEGHEIPGKEEVRNWLLAHVEVPSARLPVPMTHIEREVGAIRSIVGDVYSVPSEKIVPSGNPARVQEEKVLPQRQEVAVIGAATLPKAELDVVRDESLDAPAPKPFSPKKETVKVVALVTSSFAPEFVPGMFVSVGKKWGVVAGIQSNFLGVKEDYLATSDGSRLGSDGFIWPGGSSKTTHLSVTGGVSYFFSDYAGVYASAGYGYRNIYWDDADGQWARIEDLSARGVVLSGGVLLGWRHFSLSLGLSTVSFHTLGATLGLGVQF